ncbi:unnamed protein product, partial [Pelagomonas calceolata]
SETEPKRAAAIRPLRKRVAQRDCFQGATDFSERVLQRARAQKQGCSSRASTACSSAREGALATQQKTVRDRVPCRDSRARRRCITHLSRRDSPLHKGLAAGDNPLRSTEVPGAPRARARLSRRASSIRPQARGGLRYERSAAQLRRHPPK